MKRFGLLMASLLALALLGGCETEQTSAPAATPKASAKPPAKAVAPPAAESLPDPAETTYVYQAEGRRDPFLPIIGKKAAAFSENPLESFDLHQFKVKGLIIGMGDPKAVVAAPDGKSHILKRGVRIGKNSGVIRDISRERILVEETYQDLSGKTHTNMQEILVPKREGV